VEFIGATISSQAGLWPKARAWADRLSRGWLRRYRIESLADLCFTSLGCDPFTRKLRSAQVRALASMLPATSLVALFNALLLFVALRHSVPIQELTGWVAIMALLVVGRLHHIRGSGDAQATPATIYILVLVSALLWSAPSLFWHDYGSPNERLLILLTTVGMMCGGCVALASMPLACWTFVVLLGAVTVRLELQLGQPILAVMTVGFTLMLCWIGLRHALQFIERQRDRMDLEEQAELVKLMREFEANGSGWLWEADAELKLTYLSSDDRRWSIARVRRLIGTDVRDIADPSGRAAQVSESTKTLFRHFEEGTAFRDIAVPTIEGRWWSLSAKPTYDAERRLTGWRGLGSDITATRLHGEDAVRAARRDPLTGLANRLLVREAVEEALLWNRASGCAMLLVDLDRFKLINDTLGHAVGDLLLKQVARRLQNSVRDQAIVGRLGGDEFALVLPGEIDREVLASIAARLIESLSLVYKINGMELRVGATVGIAIAPMDARSQEELIASADLALYRAKEEGRGTHRFYEAWMSELAQAHRQLESDLRAELQDGGVTLAYQPFVAAATGVVIGYEALLRWRHPTLGNIPPDRFVPIIEDAGLMNQVGSWVIREACAEAASWTVPNRIAVNVSATQITGASLATTVVNALAETGLSADRLELEVTESIFLGEDETTLMALARLRDLGVRLVIDDFGKGYSSFGYLARARFSKIKVDQSFVQGAADGARESVAIVQAILALAGGLGVETTAEGIETAEQADAMRDLGCSQLQGFYFGRPAPAEPRPREWVALSAERKRA
jgi:diguanylate cyclase (GGDEF)-like protein